MIAGLINGLIWVLIGYVIYRSVHKPVEHAAAGSVRFRSQQYTYAMGDSIPSYPDYGYFNGLDMDLPVNMPHIYLDSLKAGGRSVDAVFDRSQRISLEGDFGEYFAVFVPNEYKDLALSILTPDVMEVLQRYAASYDVEIYGTHLRIISNAKVASNPALQTGLMEVADKVTKEIEDRGRSWSEDNDIQSFDADLLIYPTKGVRVLGRYMTWTRFWLSIFWLLCVLIFIAAGVWLMVLHLYSLAWLMFGIGIALYAVLQLMTKETQAAGRIHTGQR